MFPVQLDMQYVKLSRDGDRMIATIDFNAIRDEKTRAEIRKLLSGGEIVGSEFTACIHHRTYGSTDEYR